MLGDSQVSSAKRPLGPVTAAWEKAAVLENVKSVCLNVSSLCRVQCPPSLTCGPVLLSIARLLRPQCRGYTHCIVLLLSF